jgi:DNA-binding transcriptional regulator YdaS (Cro superfamily)
MTYQQAISHFGTPAAMARALGVDRASVAEWREKIPEGRQYQIQIATGGKLKADKPALRTEKVAA